MSHGVSGLRAEIYLTGLSQRLIAGWLVQGSTKLNEIVQLVTNSFLADHSLKYRIGIYVLIVTHLSHGSNMMEQIALSILKYSIRLPRVASGVLELCGKSKSSCIDRCKIIPTVSRTVREIHLYLCPYHVCSTLLYCDNNIAITNQFKMPSLARTKYRIK